AIGLKAFPGPRRRSRQPARCARRLAHRVERRGAAHLLHRSAALRGRAVRSPDCHAHRAAVGPLWLARRTRPRMSLPRPSGYFRTRYDEDFRLLDTRTQRAAFGLFGLGALALPFVASSFG